MTIRTARLPGGDLFGRAGEDLSGLPDRESRYQLLLLFCFCFCFFIDSIIIISIQALGFESL